MFYCYENNSIEEASDIMKQQKVRRLAVLDNETNKKPTGVVSLGDIARNNTENEQLTGEILEVISQ